jgi:hypothetical protein
MRYNRWADSTTGYGQLAQPAIWQIFGIFVRNVGVFFSRNHTKEPFRTIIIEL